MAATEDQKEHDRSRALKLPLILGLVLAVAGGGAGYYGVRNNLILANGSTLANLPDAMASPESSEPVETGFVPVDPLTISLGDTGRHLTFRATLEVEQAREREVEKLLPRVSDVLNTYLRALKVTDLRETTSLTRLRAQMLRRVQIVTGKGRVNDLLIMEFVIN